MTDPIPKIVFKASADQLGFELIDLQKLFAADQHPTNHNPFLPHRIDFFAILLIDAGNVQHQLDFRTYTLQQGDCLVFAKGQVHAFDAKHPYHGFLVVYTEDFIVQTIKVNTLAQLSGLYNIHFNSPLHHHPEAIQLFLKGIQTEANEETLFAKRELLAAHLVIFLLTLERSNQLTATSYLVNPHYELFNRFKQLVEQQYTRSRNANSYAQELTISYKTLNKVCKEFTQKTAKVFIDNYVILEAKRFLSSTTLSIKEIAYKLGFDEPTNFQKYFKKFTQSSIRDFRKKNS